MHKLLGALLVGFVLTATAGEPPATRGSIVTNYYAIDKLHAPCCAVMLKHALTNIAGVQSATVFVTNQVVRVIHTPEKKILGQIRGAFRAEIVDAKRLVKVPPGLRAPAASATAHP